jgi:hypothetical protein
MQNAGVAFPVRPTGHLGGGACIAALALAAAEADVAAVVPFSASLPQATTASRRAETVAIRMRPRIRGWRADHHNAMNWIYGRRIDDTQWRHAAPEVGAPAAGHAV